MEKGGDERAFVDEMSKDSTDSRNLGQLAVDLAAAWSEALKQIAEKVQETEKNSAADKKLINQMIEEAKQAIKQGKSIGKFVDD